MNKQREAHMGGDPAAQQAAPDAPPPASGDASDDATQIKQKIQEILALVDHWEQTGKQEEGAEALPDQGDQGEGPAY
jgi:hypothetical protein